MLTNRYWVIVENGVFFNMPSVRHLEFNHLNFGQITIITDTVWFWVQTFVITGSFFTEICQYNDFHMNSRPPSWICDDVIILHQVINFHGPDTVLHLYVYWSVSFRTSLTYRPMSDWRQTDGRTDGQTYRYRHHLKPPSHFVGQGQRPARIDEVYSPIYCYWSHLLLSSCHSLFMQEACFGEIVIK